MKTDLVIFLSLPLLVAMHDLISGNQSCSKLEFVHVPEKIVAFEGSPVSLTFYLDTRQCSPNQTRFSIIISEDDNGRHTDICKFLLSNKCMASPHSVGCSCLSPLGPMLFTKNVANNSVYVWKWGDIYPSEERRVIFTTASADAKAAHVKGTESKNDNSMVVVISASTGMCLVVIAAVVITAIAFHRRVGRRFHGTRLMHGGNRSFTVSYTQDVLQAAKTFGDQATDIYEEIGVAPKSHGRCRVGLKTGVSLPPIPDFNLYVETPCSTPGSEHEKQESAVEYLIPLVVAGTRTEETEELRVVSCTQSLAKWRPNSSFM